MTVSPRPDSGQKVTDLSLGTAFLKSRKKMIVRKHHRRVGRIAVALMVLTVMSPLPVAFDGG